MCKEKVADSRKSLTGGVGLRSQACEAMLEISRIGCSVSSVGYVSLACGASMVYYLMVIFRSWALGVIKCSGCKVVGLIRSLGHRYVVGVGLK